MTNQGWTPDPEPGTSWKAPAPEDRPPKIGSLLATLSGQVTTLVEGEIELTKRRAVEFFKKTGVGGVLIAVGAFLALYLLWWIFHTIEVAIAAALPAWAASLIVVALILIVIAVLVAVGIAMIKKGQADKPEPGKGIKADMEALKKGLGGE